MIEEYQHFYNQCPVTVFSLNEEEESIFNQIISLQDCYNTLLSRGVDDFEAWADAYLVLQGVVADTDDLNAMKEHRVLMVDNDADAKYLTKDASSTQIEFLLKTLDDQIHTISCSPNFNDEKFLAQSGEALKYKLIGLENRSTNIENQMRKALQRRIELIASIMSLTDTEEVWRDVDIRFTRNIPNSLSPTTVSELMQYKGLVSNITLLEMVPFVKDPEEELTRVDEETQKELEMTEFGHNGLAEETA